MTSHLKLFACPRPSLQHLHEYSSTRDQRATHAHQAPPPAIKGANSPDASSVVIEGIGTFSIRPPDNSIELPAETVPSPATDDPHRTSPKGAKPTEFPNKLQQADSRALAKTQMIGSHYFPEGLPKPKFLWRVTDSTSRTRLSPDGSFDTHCKLWGHWTSWTTLINAPNLNAQIDWYHRFTLPTPSSNGADPPLFISVTADCGWAYDEFERRARRRRDRVRINVIDTSSFQWEVVFLEGGGKLPVLRDRKTECTVFSSEAASRALGWRNGCRNSREWFVIRCIPARYVMPQVWSND